MSFEMDLIERGPKKKDIAATIEGIGDEELNETGRRLKISLMNLEGAMVGSSEDFTKLDLLFLKGQEYDITPKFIKFLREDIDSSELTEFQELLQTYEYMTGSSKTIRLQMEETADILAAKAATFVEQD